MENKEISISNICIHRRLVSNIPYTMDYKSSFLLFSRFEERNDNRNIGTNHPQFPSVLLSLSKPSERMFYRLKTRTGSGSNKYRIVSESFIFPFCITIDCCGRANEENRFLLAPVPIRK